MLPSRHSFCVIHLSMLFVTPSRRDAVVPVECGSVLDEKNGRCKGCQRSRLVLLIHGRHQQRAYYKEELCELCRSRRRNRCKLQNYVLFSSSSDTLCSLSTCLSDRSAVLADGCTLIGGGFCEFWI